MAPAATTALSATPDLDGKAVLALDPYLEPFVPAIEHRYNIFKEWKDKIQRTEGGYEEFTKGYKRLGFNVAEDGTVTYREWAPNASEAVLTGDFSEVSSATRR
jgi:1,4-alpha-glucan branching enzyme